MEGLTAHCMVRNEPFVYYAVKSVYDYVDEILLYDTGSYDAHTLDDILLLIDEDKDNKIIFKEVKIETDETSWTSENWVEHKNANIDKRGKGYVRKEMIEDTRTEFFMILDGDEVHYQQTMIVIRDLLLSWPEDTLFMALPLIWFYDLSHTFTQSVSGRLFVTDKVGMRVGSPGEMHTDKSTGLVLRDKKVVQNAIPYAHFERFLKPWRRVVPEQDIISYPSQLPKVMSYAPKFMERFLNENRG